MAAVLRVWYWSRWHPAVPSNPIVCDSGTFIQKDQVLSENIPYDAVQFLLPSDIHAFSAVSQLWNSILQTVNGSFIDSHLPNPGSSTNNNILLIHWRLKKNYIYGGKTHKVTNRQPLFSTGAIITNAKNLWYASQITSLGEMCFSLNAEIKRLLPILNCNFSQLFGVQYFICSSEV